MGYLPYNLWFGDCGLQKYEIKLCLNVNRIETTLASSERCFEFALINGSFCATSETPSGHFSLFMFCLWKKIRTDVVCAPNIGKCVSDGGPQRRPFRTSKGGQQVQENHMETFSSHH